MGLGTVATRTVSVHTTFASYTTLSCNPAASAPAPAVPAAPSERNAALQPLTDEPRRPLTWTLCCKGPSSPLGTEASATNGWDNNESVVPLWLESVCIAQARKSRKPAEKKSWLFVQWSRRHSRVSKPKVFQRCTGQPVAPLGRPKLCVAHRHLQRQRFVTIQATNEINESAHLNGRLPRWGTCCHLSTSSRREMSPEGVRLRLRLRPKDKGQVPL